MKIDSFRFIARVLNKTGTTPAMSQSVKHAGIWIRVSTEEQAQGESPENHLARARMYCELHDWQAVEIYDLSGVSGKSVINHPEATRAVWRAGPGCGGAAASKRGGPG